MKDIIREMLYAMKRAGIIDDGEFTVLIERLWAVDDPSDWSLG